MPCQARPVERVFGDAVKRTSVTGADNGLHFHAADHLRGRHGPLSVTTADVNGDGRRRPRHGERQPATRCRCCWATATARSARRPPSRSATSPFSVATADFNGDGDADLVMRTGTATRCRCCWATATARSARRPPSRPATCPISVTAADVNGDGRRRPRHGQPGQRHGVGAAGQRRRHVRRADHLRRRQRSRSRWRRRTSTATARPDLVTANCDQRHGVGAAGQRRRHVRRADHLRGRRRCRSR